MARQWRTDGAYGLRQAAKGGNICPLATQRNAVGRRPLTTRNGPLGQKPCWRQSKTPGTRGTEMLKNEWPNALRTAYSRQLPDLRANTTATGVQRQSLGQQVVAPQPGKCVQRNRRSRTLLFGKTLGVLVQKRGKTGGKPLARRAISVCETGRFAS